MTTTADTNTADTTVKSAITCTTDADLAPPSLAAWKSAVAAREERRAEDAKAAAERLRRANETVEIRAAQVVLDYFAGLLRDGEDPWGEARFITITKKDMREAFALYDEDRGANPGVTELTHGICHRAAFALTEWGASCETYTTAFGTEGVLVMLPNPNDPPTDEDYMHVQRTRKTLYDY